MMEVTHLVAEPGNMTRYEIFAFPAAGHGRGTWCVVFPQMNRSILLSEGAYVAMGYLREKMGPLKSFRNDPDLSEFLKLIKKAIPDIEVECCTDDTGHMLSDAAT